MRFAEDRVSYTRTVGFEGKVKDGLREHSHLEGTLLPEAVKGELNAL